MAPVTPALVARMRQLLADGASYAETARTVGVDASTVRRYLPGYGWSAQQAGQLGRMHSNG